MGKTHLRQAVFSTFGVVLAVFLLGTIGCTSLKPGADLREVDLGGRDLVGKDLHGANLSGASLVGMDLAGAVLRNANLSNADLRDANLGGADLGGADLKGTDLRDANLSGADLLDADLSAAVLAGARLDGARLRGANLTGAVLPPSLRESDFAGAVFKNADLAGADLSNLDLSSLNFEGARLTGAALRDSDLSHADLVGADLSYADLAGADLGGADLSNSDLTGAWLGAATLTGADLSDANLSMANLELVIDLPEDGLSKAISQQALLGETWLFGLFSEACRGRPIPGAADLEPVSSELDYILLNGDGTAPYGGWRQRVLSIGSVRYVVCIEEVTVTLESCRYIPLGDVDVERIDAKVKVVDIGSGEMVASELLRGEEPEVDYCPVSICVGDGCGGTTPIGDLKGDGVPDEQIHEFVRTSVDSYEAETRE